MRCRWNDRGSCKSVFNSSKRARVACYILSMADASLSLSTTLADRYTVERLLGYGGMATVHLAEERKHKRKVAIKILKQEFGASVGAERFLRESGIASRLSHR